MRVRSGVRAAAVVATAAGLLMGSAGVASAALVPHERMVGANPVDWTPHASNGAARKVLQIGNRIYVGGTFTAIRQTETSADIAQRYLFAFDATTGKIDSGFAPVLDGTVESLAAAPDGASLYAVGYFNNANGQPMQKVARLDAATGTNVAGFKAPKFSSSVEDVAVVSGRLIVGGAFKWVAGTVRPALVSLNATTGAPDSFADLGFAGPRRTTTKTAPLSVADLDVSADGRTLVALGNFSTVAGQSRHQLAVIDVGGSQATLRNWATDRYQPTCSSSFPSYVRGLSISPDGSYFVVSTTGAHRVGTLCDAAARWELTQSGTTLQPTWINYTGQDTLWSAGITGPVVYIGGHQRWVNNTAGRDFAGPGAVSRPGVAALDPRNGLPFSWNPTKARGVAVFDLYSTTQGLWIASDTSKLAREYHGKFGLMPLDAGKSLPADLTGTLPADVYLPGTGDVPAVTFTGTSASGERTVPAGGLDWTQARGAAMIDGTVYFAWSDGTLKRRGFDGNKFAWKTYNVDLRGLETTSFATDLATMSGMFFDRAAGRLYYTVEGQQKLYYRYFTPESSTVGADRFEAVSTNANGVAWDTARGMFLTGGKLYYGSTDGKLRQVAFSGGRLSGTAAVVTGSGVTERSWSAPGMFLDSGA
ncbi:MAG: hypothetical protein H0W56_02510 [Acidothermales bacterium]|nr:hypothetical protein [Acidothermales bacterium]